MHDPFVGLLTAVPLRKARIVFTGEEGLRVGALVTAGVSNATSAGVSRPCESRPGTINIILLLDAKLTRSAMLNAIITATDTVTVAMTGLGLTQPYAGPATVLGWLIAKTVRQAVQESLLAA